MTGGFERLSAPDPRTLHFGAGALLPGLLRPDDAVTVQEFAISSAVLSPAVPSELSEQFERLRDKHIRGVMDYRNFAEVGNDAIRLYEPALKQRFLEFYLGQDIPFIRRDGTATPLRATNYRTVYDHVRGNAEGLDISAADGRSTPFNGTLGGLLSWARQAGLLRGQRARYHEESVRQMRNSVSHGGGYRLELPLTSATELCDLAEFINQLWDAPTPGGRLYPAPVEQELLALGRCADGSNLLGHAVTLTEDDDPSADWTLFAGVLPITPRWAGFDSRYLITTLPTQYLWGPGTATDARRWMAGQPPDLGTVDPIDQLVLIRHHRSDLYLPQRPEVAAALPSQERTGEWRLMLADQPLTAFTCTRSKINRVDGHESGCACATTLVARGTWQKMRHHLGILRPDLNTDPRYTLPSQLPPDLRIGCGWRAPPRSITVNHPAR